MSSNFEQVDALIRSGLFGRALECLEREPRALQAIDKYRYDTTRAELLYRTGQIARAADATSKLLRESLPLRFTAKAACIAAVADFEEGNFERSLEHIHQSVRMAEAQGDPHLIATAHLALLRLVADTESTVVPILRDVRRVIARTGDPHLMIGLRLHFARVEASRRSPTESERHLKAADSLLQEFPNAWLQGRVHLGYCIVGTLTNDYERAIREAKLAIECAALCGHPRMELAGLINLSHALQSIGDFGGAMKAINRVLATSSDDIEIKMAALDSRANVLIRQECLLEAEETIREIDRLLNSMPIDLRTRWVGSTISETRVRLMHAQGRWASANIELTHAISLSVSQQDPYWESRFLLLKLEGLTAERRFPEAGHLLMRLSQHETLERIGERYRLIGAALVASGATEVGSALLRRALRVAQSVDSDLGTKRESVEQEGNLIKHDGDISGLSPADSPPNLDSAVALIELGGHPHILAREVLAVLDAAQCARAVAVVATGRSGPRVIDQRGWDGAMALAAARKPDPYEIVALGEHRDEPWQLIVDPKPELEHRCALIAVRKLVATALTLERYRREEQQRAALWPAEALDSDPESVWASEQMSEVLGVARRIAPTPLSVLITGETGTGKEMLARAIHRASDRADKPMIPFNCTAVPRDMIDSQLFGYRRGAFTGADASFAGVIRSAVGGTLFLDEIADVPLDVQPKLLRFLETHEIHPLGEMQAVKVDVRVVAATNARLEQLVAEGKFREDLYYRLNVVQLKLPPLRERREEIPPLVEHYLRKYGDEQKKGRLTLSDETLEYLLLYSWPGNIRQLANEVRRMVAMAEVNATLTPAQLSPEIQSSRRTIPAVATSDPEVRVRIDQPLPVAVEMLEQTMVRSALDRTHGRVEEAARMLGISRKGLFLKRRRWGMQHH